MILALGFQLSVALAQTNSWIKPTSGYWEEPFWSLGVLPSFSQSAIEFTNPGFKALAIGSSTTANYPDSLRIRNFTVDAPSESGNLLLLNYAGLNVPLDVTDWLTIGTNGSLLSYYSALECDWVDVRGHATFAEFGRTRSHSFYLQNGGQLVLSNGWFEALNEVLETGAEVVNGGLRTVGCAWSQYGGTNQFTFMSVYSDSTYNLYDGTLKSTGAQMAHIGVSVGPTEATLRVAGGIADMGEVVLGDNFDGPNNWGGAFGWLRLSDGLFKSPRLNVKQGGVQQTGGTNQAGSILLPGPDPWIGPGSRANYLMEAGHLSSIFVPIGQYHLGSFQHSGGNHTNIQGIVIYTNSVYDFSAGSLSAPSIDLRGGTFRHSSPTNFIATNYCPQLFIAQGGRYSHFSGFLTTFNLSVMHSVDSNYQFLDRGYVQVGGEHRASSIVIDSGGLYYLWAGTLSGNTSISVGAQGQFRLGSNAVVTGNNTFNLRTSGILALHSGNHQLGSLRVSGSAAIDFVSTNSATIRFRDAGYTTGALDGNLTISNWVRGVHHIYVGTITDAQLRLITFANPGGYPPGNYSARVTESGEIVPLEPGRITFTRSGGGSSNSFTLTWPEGYQLYSAPEVTGPYAPVPNASSPYQVSFTEPQRFFKLVPMGTGSTP